jgi:hypothetical protein
MKAHIFLVALGFLAACMVAGAVIADLLKGDLSKDLDEANGEDGE